MQVNEMENEDGSLTLMFEMTREEEKALLQYALRDILTKAVEVKDE